MCGRTPLDHQVVMVVDHKVPRHWGGSDEISNLQPLCEECNAGKKAYFANYDQYADAIRQSAEHPEPHGRIGELIKAFRGDWVPAELIELVASMKQYQEDWRKRTRELRLLGWTYETKKRKDPKNKPDPRLVSRNRLETLAGGFHRSRGPSTRSIEQTSIPIGSVTSVRPQVGDFSCWTATYYFYGLVLITTYVPCASDLLKIVVFLEMSWQNFSNSRMSPGEDVNQDIMWPKCMA
ncbi:HNH endonuclease [Nonomuraea ferruginea]